MMLPQKQTPTNPKEPPALFDIPSGEPAGAQYLPVRDKLAALDAIFKDPDVKHGLGLFAAYEQKVLDLWQKGSRFYLHCLARNKKVLAKPEEIIRQLCIRRLVDMGYTLEQLAVEVPVKMGSVIHSKAADIVVYREELLRLTPYIIVELKRPQRRDGLDQLETYMNPLGAPFGWWLNGNDQIIRYREEPNLFESISRLPNAGETIDTCAHPAKNVT